jgi:hypothetical protein
MLIWKDILVYVDDLEDLLMTDRESAKDRRSVGGTDTEAK